MRGSSAPRRISAYARNGQRFWSSSARTPFARVRPAGQGAPRTSTIGHQCRRRQRAQPLHQRRHRGLDRVRRPRAQQRTRRELRVVVAPRGTEAHLGGRLLPGHHGLARALQAARRSAGRNRGAALQGPGNVRIESRGRRPGLGLQAADADAVVAHHRVVDRGGDQHGKVGADRRERLATRHAGEHVDGAHRGAGTERASQVGELLQQRLPAVERLLPGGVGGAAAGPAQRLECDRKRLGPARRVQPAHRPAGAAPRAAASPALRNDGRPGKPRPTPAGPRPRRDRRPVGPAASAPPARARRARPPARIAPRAPPRPRGPSPTGSTAPAVRAPPRARRSPRASHRPRSQKPAAPARGRNRPRARASRAALGRDGSAAARVLAPPATGARKDPHAGARRTIRPHSAGRRAGRSPAPPAPLAVDRSRPSARVTANDIPRPCQASTRWRSAGVSGPCPTSLDRTAAERRRISARQRRPQPMARQRAERQPRGRSTCSMPRASHRASLPGSAAIAAVGMR